MFYLQHQQLSFRIIFSFSDSFLIWIFKNTYDLEWLD